MDLGNIGICTISGNYHIAFEIYKLKQGVEGENVASRKFCMFFLVMSNQGSNSYLSQNNYKEVTPKGV